MTMPFSTASRVALYAAHSAASSSGRGSCDQREPKTREREATGSCRCWCARISVDLLLFSQQACTGTRCTCEACILRVTRVLGAGKLGFSCSSASGATAFSRADAADIVVTLAM